MLARGRVLSWCAAVMLLLARGAAFQLPSFQRQPPASNTVQQPSQGSYTKTNPVLKAAVGLLTNGLNGVVGAEEDEAVLASGAGKRARSISPTALKSKIQRDYEAAYFLTGDISADAYDDDCVFTGLKVFFREPRLELRAIDLNTAKRTVETRWRLMCELALPWRPFIDVEGGTVHRYDPARGGRVVEHVESWGVSALDAVLQIFKPGGRGRGNTKSVTAGPLSKAKASMNLLAGLAIPVLSTFSGPLLDGVPRAYAAEDRRQVADIPASGIIFKDSINIEAFRDPKVDGVTIYISDFRRPLAERLQKDFFSDPSQASVACVRTGSVTMRGIDMSKAGEEVFSEARSLLFKTIRVRRVYDKEANAIIYVSYSTRLTKNDDDNKSRFKSSLCAVPLDGEKVEIIQ